MFVGNAISVRISCGQFLHRDAEGVMTVMRRNDWLDLCRALAILLVMLSHGRVFLRSAMPWAEYFRFGGFLGVELFFVLSGFLIGGILIRLSRQGGTHWLGGFYARRWFRTLPNYYLFVLINILLVWWGTRPGELDEVWKYLVFIQNLFGPHPLFFPEAWSLAVEEVFYLFIPGPVSAAEPVVGFAVRPLDPDCRPERGPVFPAGAPAGCELDRVVGRGDQKSGVLALRYLDVRRAAGLGV